MGHAEPLTPGLLLVDVDADDHVGADKAQALDDVEPDAAQPEDDGRCAGLDLGRVDHGADAGRDAAADVADLVERRVLADFRDGDLRQHRVVSRTSTCPCSGAPSSPRREAAGAVRHDPLALRGADGRAQVRLAREARWAIPAFGRVKRNDVIAFLDARHPRTDIDDDAGPLVAKDSRKETLRIGPRQCEIVGMADASRLDLDKDLSLLGTFKIELDDLERLGLFESDGGARLHFPAPVEWRSNLSSLCQPKVKPKTMARPEMLLKKAGALSCAEAGPRTAHQACQVEWFNRARRR